MVVRNPEFHTFFQTNSQKESLEKGRTELKSSNKADFPAEKLI